MPFPDDTFTIGFSSLVLEYFPQIDDVRAGTAHVLTSGVLSYFLYAEHSLPKRTVFSCRLRVFCIQGLADRYTEWFWAISCTAHANKPDEWLAHLEKAGFRLERWWHYFSPDAMRVLEWGHLFGVPSLIFKKLFGGRIVSPTT